MQLVILWYYCRICSLSSHPNSTFNLLHFSYSDLRSRYLLFSLRHFDFKALLLLWASQSVFYHALKMIPLVISLELLAFNSHIDYSLQLSLSKRQSYIPLLIDDRKTRNTDARFLLKQIHSFS